MVRASGNQDSECFKGIKGTLVECEKVLEWIRSLNRDIEPSENMEMTGRFMELKERSEQLKTQRKTEKEFRLFTQGEINELIASHLKPLKGGTGHDVSRYLFQLKSKTQEMGVFDILRREF